MNKINYKTMSLEMLEEQREKWIAEYKNPVVDMIDTVLDALGENKEYCHTNYRALKINESGVVILIMRTLILDKRNEPAGRLYRVLIDPVIIIEDPDYHPKSWKYQPVYLLNGTDLLDGKLVKSHITPGDWILDIKKLYPKAAGILKRAAMKEKNDSAKCLYIDMALDIAKEINLKKTK